MTTEESKFLEHHRILYRVNGWAERTPKDYFLIGRDGVQQGVLLQTAVGGKMLLLGAQGGYYDEAIGWQKIEDIELVADLGVARRSEVDFVEDWLKGQKAEGGGQRAEGQEQGGQATKTHDDQR